MPVARSHSCAIFLSSPRLSFVFSEAKNRDLRGFCVRSGTFHVTLLAQLAGLRLGVASWACSGSQKGPEQFGFVMRPLPNADLTFFLSNESPGESMPANDWYALPLFSIPTFIMLQQDKLAVQTYHSPQSNVQGRNMMMCSKNKVSVCCFSFSFYTGFLGPRQKPWAGQASSRAPRPHISDHGTIRGGHAGGAYLADPWMNSTLVQIVFGSG